MKKVMGLVIGLLPVSAFGECVPVPDCASIGYTETSCEGDSIKCPFDTSKLYCPPCDSSFKYSCSGDNIIGGVGRVCNNKYVNCKCISGATFNNGECVCDTSCDTIGNIYYSDGTCSSCNLTDKTSVGIIAYKDDNKHLIISLETSVKMLWAWNQTDAEGNTIILWNKDLNLTNYGSSGLYLQDYNGFENTQVIVEAFGENATSVAAIYCYNYVPSGWESTKHQWYLPAAGELYNIVFNNKDNINKGLTALGIASLNTGHHWSSSENGYDRAWTVNFNNGGTNNTSKNYSNVVTCLLAI